jgi:hypothetical protein
MKIRNFKEIILSVLFLAACGGGGGGGSSTPSIPSPAVTISSSAASAVVGETVTISWSSTNATSCSASGAWSGSKSVNGNEDVTIGTSGTNNYSLSCTGEGGSGSSSTTVTGIANISGVVVDGYIRDASVFLDADADFILDSDETTTTSDANGSFILPNLDNNVVAINGVDADSNNTLTNFSLVQGANTSVDFRAITPITSIAFHLTDPSNINTKLGIDSSIDINSTDPVANIDQGNSYKFLYEKGNQVTVLIYSMQSAINNINGSQDTSEVYFSSLASTLTSQYDSNSEAVNIESQAFVNAYIDEVMENITATISEENKQNLKNTLKSILPVISVRNDSNITTAITNFITGTFITDFISIAKGEASEDLVNNYATNINSLIAADQGIDSDELVQQILIVDDSFSVDEDESITFDILSNDTIEAGLDYFGLFVDLSSAISGIATLNADLSVTYEPGLNFNGTEELIYSVNVDGTVASGNIVITINPVNDAPIFEDLPSDFSKEENNISVTTVSVSDVEGDAIGFSLTGDDKELFAISGTGSITFVSNPDFENPSDSGQDNIYDINVVASDGTDSVTQAITIQILDVENEGNPVIAGLASSIAVDENQGSVTQFTVSDPQNDTIAASLSGADKDLFALIFDGSAATLTMSSVDYESPVDLDSNNIYSVSVNFSDDLNTTTQTVEFSINNLNDNIPVFNSNFSTSVSIDENQLSVTSVQASDADGDVILYSLSGGDSSDFFVSESGLITMNSAPNFEAKSSYAFNLSITDGVNEAAVGMNITILDINDAPSWNTYSSFIESDENIATNITSLSVSDEDNDVITYSLSGDDAALFNIVNTAGTGIVSFLTSPDFENSSDSNSDNIYYFIVNASDGNVLITSAPIGISINNLNDNPPVISNLPENVDVSNGQTSIVTISVTDADNDNAELSLSGTDALALSITSEGVIAFNTSPNFASPTDSDGNNVYEFTVHANDVVHDVTQSATVTVLETNDPPTFTDLESSYTVDENTVDVTKVNASDPDGSPITFSITGDDASSFSIVSSGTLSFAVNADYENPSDINSNNTYDINVVISDGTNEVSQAVSIIVNEIPEAPEFVGLPAVFNLEENDNTITTIEVVDPEGDDFTYEMTGPDVDQFLLGSNGFLRVSAVEGFDYENPTDANGDNIYELVLTATETKSGGLQRVQDFKIQVSDLKDTFTLGGTIFSGINTLMDGDVVMLGQVRPNPDGDDGYYGYPDIPNDSLSEAQVLITPTDVAGFIGDDIFQQLSFDAQGSVIRDENGDVIYTSVERPDDEDWYKLDLVPNLQITLSVEDYQETVTDDNGNETIVTNKATLLLYDSGGTLADYQYTSGSTEEYQTINLPDSGVYYAVVKQDVNNTKYALALGSVVSAAEATFTTSKDAYAEGRMITYRRFDKNIDSGDLKDIANQNINLDTKLKMLDESNFMGLRTINFDYIDEYASIYGNNTYLDSASFIDSATLNQIKYLKHWRILQHYRNIHPKLDLEFDFKVYKLAGFTQDEYWSYQWGLQNIGLDVVLNAIGQETQNVAVAVIDSGSPATTSTAWTTSAFLEGGYDFAPIDSSGDGDGNDPDPTDHSPTGGSHGTHVATTITALNDGNNINGFGVHVVPFNVFGISGGAYVSDTIGAMLYSAGLQNESGTFYTGSIPIKVINLSLGSSGGSCGSSYTNSIKDVTDAGITVVAASGNEAIEEPGGFGYPASCENVISVASVDPVNNRAYYSTYNNMVDIAAPGGTTGTDINGDGQGDGILAFDGNESLAVYQGTSMASPHVAGAIAVLYGLKPDWTPIQMEAFINSGYLTDDIGVEGKDDEYGIGMLNLSKGFTALIDGGLDFTYATITPGSFNFGYTDTEKVITVNKVGTGDLSVTGLTASNTSLVDITALEIDSSGFGTYKLTLTRSDEPDGSYQSSISASISDDTTVNVTFLYSVGEQRQRPYIGYTYLLLIDDEGEAEGGWYVDLGPEGISFQVEDIPNGSYYWLFSTELDDNNYVGEYGEMIETYPELSSSAQYFDLVDEDINNSAVYLAVRKSSGSLSSSSGINDKKKIKINLDNLNQPKLRIIKKDQNN